MTAKGSPEQMRAAAKAAFANAGSFADDARALIERGSHGHAVALTVLAQEEMGKGYLWQMKAAGFNIGARRFIDHPPKLTTIYILSFLEVVAGKQANELRRIISSEAPLAERVEAVKAWQAAHQEESSAEEERFWAEMDALATWYESLNQRKLDGLYVDVTEAGQIKTPETVTKAAAVALLRTLHDRMRRLEKVTQDLTLLTEGNPAGRQGVVDVLRKAFEGDFGGWTEATKATRKRAAGQASGGDDHRAQS